MTDTSGAASAPTTRHPEAPTTSQALRQYVYTGVSEEQRPTAGCGQQRVEGPAGEQLPNCAAELNAQWHLWIQSCKNAAHRMAIKVRVRVE